MEPREGLPKAHPPPFRFYTQQPSTILLNTPISQFDILTRQLTPPASRILDFTHHDNPFQHHLVR